MNQIAYNMITIDDLRTMNNNEISRIFMYVSEDRFKSSIADKVYRWCVNEMNRRSDELINIEVILFGK